MTTGDIGRDVICGFTDDRQVVNDGVEEFFIVFEGLEIDIGSEALDFCNRVGDVLDPESPISRRHGSLPAGCVLSTPA